MHRRPGKPWNRGISWGKYLPWDIFSFHNGPGRMTDGIMGPAGDRIEADM